MTDNQNTVTENTERTDFWAAFYEKRALSRVAWAIAVPSILFFLASQFLSYILLFLGGKIGLSAERISRVVSDPAVLQIIQVIMSVVLFTFPYILAAKILGAKVGRIAGLNKPKEKTILPYLLFGIGFCAFANIIVAYAGRVFERFGLGYSMPEDKNPEGFFGFLLVLISTAFVPALIEEFAYRGIAIGLLKPFGEGFAIVASAAAFAVLHGNFSQIAFAFFVGLVLGFIRIKTNSLLVPVAVHCINNTIAVISSYDLGFSAAVTNILYGVYLALALTAAIFAVALIGKDGFALNAPQTVNGTKKTYITYFFAPGTIIFFALFIFRACTYIV